ncbi:hypothetical protein AVEN_111119-1 [Araneus ventricosus]|uniref:Uncharacterized protein n=1 Tax=Araneus ventricosus TaxID=182803 RepID=A0A4Y2WN62_ARAVE|nr:hypothetical protein AVEN_111119-1 [Araneus ventricosus]
MIYKFHCQSFDPSTERIQCYNDASAHVSIQPVRCRNGIRYGDTGRRSVWWVKARKMIRRKKIIGLSSGSALNQHYLKNWLINARFGNDILSVIELAA